MNVQDPSSSTHAHHVERRQPLEPLNDPVLQDWTGFRFHKRAKIGDNTDNINTERHIEGTLLPKTPTTNRITNHNAILSTPTTPAQNRIVSLLGNPLQKVYGRNNNEYDRMSASQLLSPEREEDIRTIPSSTSIATSRIERIKQDLPPNNIPDSDYIQLLPTNARDIIQMQQLFYWFMKLEKDQRIPVKKDHPIVNRAKQKLLMELANSISIVSWHKHPDTVISPLVKPNPNNIKNQNRLKEIEKDMEDLQKELEDWEQRHQEVLDRHAEALEKPENNNFVVEYDESFIDKLEPGQREFVKNFLEEEPEYNISDEVADMPKEISQLLQLLVRVDQVQRQAGEMIGEYNTEIAHKVRERSRIIPIDSDDQVLGLFEDTEEERRQSEFQNAHNILRLLSRQYSATTESDTTMEDEDDTPMDIDD